MSTSEISPRNSWQCKDSNTATDPDQQQLHPYLLTPAAAALAAATTSGRVPGAGTSQPTSAWTSAGTATGRHGPTRAGLIGYDIIDSRRRDESVVEVDLYYSPSDSDAAEEDPSRVKEVRPLLLLTDGMDNGRSSATAGVDGSSSSSSTESGTGDRYTTPSCGRREHILDTHPRGAEMEEHLDGQPWLGVNHQEQCEKSQQAFCRFHQATENPGPPNNSIESSGRYSGSSSNSSSSVSKGEAQNVSSGVDHGPPVLQQEAPWFQQYKRRRIMRAAASLPFEAPTTSAADAEAGSYSSISRDEDYQSVTQT